MNDYLDQKRFPLTTQPGLTLDQQRLIDALNLDGLQEASDNGEQLSEQQKNKLAELKAKDKLVSGKSS